MNWKPHAAHLADSAVHPASRWYPVVAAIPRHVFIPRWWAWSAPGLGLLTTCDATGPLPGNHDRIVATVAVRPIPPGWLTALRPGGRLVTTITGTNLILTADKTPDGGATGRTEWDRAGFMQTRTGPGYPPGTLQQLTAIRDASGDQLTTGRFPVANVNEAWELYSTLGVMAPGIQHHYEETGDGQRTAWMIHPDGSWHAQPRPATRRLPSTSPAPADSGTSSTTSATTGSATDHCPPTEPRPPSPRTAQSPSPADTGRPPSRHHELMSDSRSPCCGPRLAADRVPAQAVLVGGLDGLALDPKEVLEARLFSPGNLPDGMPETHRDLAASL